MTRFAVTLRGSAGVAVLALVAVGCASGAGPDWTYAPLGPTPSGGAAASATPAGSPGLPIDVETPQEQSLAFVPNTLEAPAATAVTVNYNNNSNSPHNINFFDGPDQNAPSLGATKVVTGPNALESVSFTTPDQPGDYFFWCDVHGSQMVGTLRVTEGGAPSGAPPASGAESPAPSGSAAASAAPSAPSSATASQAPQVSPSAAP